MNAESLFEAVKSGDLAEVQRFLKRNPNIEVDALNGFGSTSLLNAIAKNHEAIIEVLLAYGAAVNGPVGAYRTPLQMACESEKADIVSSLLEHGADVDAMTAYDRQTPLIRTCWSNRNLSIAQLLINAGADVNGAGGVIAPLHVAAWNGNTEAIELLIQSGADVNILSSREYGVPPGVSAGSTPLHFVAAATFAEINEAQFSNLNILLAAGADSNIANPEGRTPLHLAALHSSFDVITALLDVGCDPLHQDNNGRTPLQYLYERHDEEAFSVYHCNIITALVAAGDRSWECVPTPCPGLEAAMLSVWQNAPDELPELVRRLNDPPGTLVELYAHMDGDDAMKKVVQEVLRVLHRHFAGFSHLKEDLLNSIFDFKFQEHSAAEEEEEEEEEEEIEEEDGVDDDEEEEEEEDDDDNVAALLLPSSSFLLYYY